MSLTFLHVRNRSQWCQEGTQIEKKLHLKELPPIKGVMVGLCRNWEVIFKDWTEREEIDNWIWSECSRRLPSPLYIPPVEKSGVNHLTTNKIHYTFIQLFTLHVLDCARAFIVLSKPRCLLGPHTSGQSGPLIAIPSYLQNWPTSTVVLLWSTLTDLITAFILWLVCGRKVVKTVWN